MTIHVIKSIYPFRSVPLRNLDLPDTDEHPEKDKRGTVTS
jgi:hypothetical protein